MVTTVRVDCPATNETVAGHSGSDYAQASLDGKPIRVVFADERWLMCKLKRAMLHLSAYDIVTNNHSSETTHILPAELSE